MPPGSFVGPKMAGAPSAGGGGALAVLTVYFGPLPPWLPITLHSMAANPRVSFAVVGDAPPPARLPPNVRFVTTPYAEMQANIAALVGRRVAYTDTYKANDIKPLLAELYPALVRGHEWWAWADLDVVFGDLLKFIRLAEPKPACCAGLEITCGKRARRDVTSRCYNSTRARETADTFFNARACACADASARSTAISPLYPNPWRKKSWGPLTVFRADANGTALYRRTPRWRDVLTTPVYTHFDEWWGSFSSLSGKGFETMGDVMTRAADAGSLRMSRAKLPFAEAKSCEDVECTFCPCGALRFTLGGGRLLVNDAEVMVLHLAESKVAWARAARLPDYPALPPPIDSTAAARAAETTAGEPVGACVHVAGLGHFDDGELLSTIPALCDERTRLARHRPAEGKSSLCLRYAGAGGGGADEARRRGTRAADVDAAPPVRVWGCDRPVAAALAAAEPSAVLHHAAHFGPRIAGAEPSVGAVRASFDAVASRYAAFTAAEASRSLDWICAWSRLSDLYVSSILPSVDTTDRAARRLPLVGKNRRVRTPLWQGERIGWWRRWWPDAGPADTRLASSASGPCAQARAAAAGASISTPGHCAAPAMDGLRAQPMQGQPCLAAPKAGASSSTWQNALFDGYVAWKRATDVEVIRARRWRCSWLYLMRACLAAERAPRATHAGAPSGSTRAACASVRPPELAGELGWGRHDPANASNLGHLLFTWRCW